MVLILDNVDIYVQVAERLPDETLQEYKDIFSFFDRWVFRWGKFVQKL